VFEAIEEVEEDYSVHSETSSGEARENLRNADLSDEED
jgi:hypothetical protein